MAVDLLAILGGLFLFIGWASERIQRRGVGRDEA